MGMRVAVVKPRDLGQLASALEKRLQGSCCEATRSRSLWSGLSRLNPSPTSMLSVLLLSYLGQLC